MAMTITEAMVNGHGICHGGFIFTLADSAFAFACNSHGDRTVAQHCSITFLRPGRVGETLRAEAKERVRAGRTGMTDVRVLGEDGLEVPPGTPGIGPLNATPKSIRLIEVCAEKPQRVPP